MFEDIIIVFRINNTDIMFDFIEYYYFSSSGMRLVLDKTFVKNHIKSNRRIGKYEVLSSI